ncbi:MAG: efflux RND transporter periplasmic adaptor subunit [Leptospiraceae bacterium]|nr:efflux RND transporter periplasmic adaptor subunit [Leptospiraceae bacterium]
MKERFKELIEFIKNKPYLKKTFITLVVYFLITLLYSNLTWDSLRAKVPILNTMFYSQRLSIASYFNSSSKAESNDRNSYDSVLKVKIYKVEKKDVSPTIQSSGSIEPIEKVEVYSKVSGRIENFFVSEGDRITIKQKLLKIESLSNEIELTKQEAALQSYKAKLQLIQEKYNEAKKRVEVRFNEADKKISAYNKAKLELERSKEVYIKKETLVANNAISKEDYETSKLDYQSKESAYEIAKRDLNISLLGLKDEDILKEGLEIPKDKNLKNQLLKDLNTKIEKSEVEVAKKETEAAEANLRATKMMINECTIYSPINGFVSERLKSTGVLINSGGGTGSSQAIMTLVQIDKVIASFYVNEQESAQLLVNMTVNIKSDTFPEEVFKGKIKTINPEIDKKTHTTKIGVLLENTELKLKPGMFIRAEIITGESVKLMLVPFSLIRPIEDNFAEIFVLKQSNEQGKFNVFKTRVKPGKKYGEDIEIKEGLNEGDIIPTNHLSQLKDGAEVKPIFE